MNDDRKEKIMDIIESVIRDENFQNKIKFPCVFFLRK